MRTYDFSPLYRNFVGLDRMADLIDSASRANAAGDAYPPYNVVQTSPDDYRIELAVAGFGESDFDIETRENVLTITARKDIGANDPVENPTYLHKGIAERGFERSFQLADHVVVSGADLKHGLLTLSLKREIPEALKPRKISLNAVPTHQAVRKRDESLTASKARRKSKAA